MLKRLEKLSKARCVFELNTYDFWGRVRTMDEIKGNSRYTVVIIDTSAFHDANSDFLGINSEMLPSFFEALKEKDILLLAHPVIDGEIKKHLSDSSLVKNQQKLETYLNKNEKLLRIAGCYDGGLINKIKAYDIKDRLYKEYLNIYDDAVRLPYPSMETVFEKYFKAIPPFADTGKKKAEFPDAVIIESVRDYMKEHDNDSLLVVSRDGDWEEAFEDDNVRVVDSIEKAITLVNEMDCVLNDEMMCEIFDSALDEIKQQLEFLFDLECYDVPEFEFESDFNAESIEIVDVSDIFIPLKVSRKQLLLQTEVEISVSGTGVIYDEDRSVWDSEDKYYWVREIADLDVQKGVGRIKAEILIEFDFDNPTEVEVLKTKLINIGNIDLDLLEYKIDPIYSDEDQYEYLEALEGHTP